jgi:hypothetical protein
MRGWRRSLTASVLLVVAWTGLASSPARAAAEGQITIARTESTAARWFNPAEAEGIILEKRLRHVIQSQSATPGNTATRLDAFVAATGAFTYGTYPDIEGLVREQAAELDRGKREAIQHCIQPLMHEKVRYAPLMDVAVVGAHGPGVAESAIGLITNMAASAPYEELRLRGK